MLEFTNILIALMILLVMDAASRDQLGPNGAAARTASAVLAGGGAMAALTAIGVLVRSPGI